MLFIELNEVENVVIILIRSCHFVTLLVWIGFSEFNVNRFDVFVFRGPFSVGLQLVIITRVWILTAQL